MPTIRQAAQAGRVRTRTTRSRRRRALPRPARDVSYDLGMAARRPKVERVSQDSYRIIFDRPLEAEVALMYFGFYPNTSLFWKNGRVVSVVAPATTYEQIVRDFSDEPADPNELAGR